MDDSSRTPSEISRRRVVQLLGAGAAATAVGTTLTGTTAVAHSKSHTGLIAAVLDDTDGHTAARGLTRLLRNAGFTVVALNPNQPVRLKAGLVPAPAVPVAETAPADPAPAGPQDVHLVAFGSFAGASYSTFVANQRASLQDFVRAGGVVLDLAKSDVPGEGVPYLPVYQAHWTNGVWNSPASRWEDDAMAAVRTDADFNTVYPVVSLDPKAAHPLVQALTASGGQVFTGRRTSRLDGTVTRPISSSWETFGAWRDMRVLLACAPGTSGFPAALLEGMDRDGTGRYLISSLTIDKCYAADGTTAVESPAAIEDSHEFFHALASYVNVVRTGKAPAVTPTPSPKAGPLVGDVGVSTARIWARPGLTGSWKCEVREGTTVRATQTRSTVAANDDTVLFDMAGLTAYTAYTFTITPDAAVSFVPLTGSFRTAPATSATPVTLGFGSCAHSVPNPVWNQIIAKGCEGFVMLGDTPYVDNGVVGFTGTPLEKAHRQHRDFLAAPGIDRLVSSMPVWATWDDHDFGKNNADGTFSDKAAYRQAFIDYRANATFGHASDSSTQPLTTRDTGLGVYTSFRRGPVEVFLLDPRWFSDVKAKACLGPVQMAWLKAGLSASTATFKILASGMTWYNKSGSETDEWHSYTDERNEIFKYIKDNGIKGCVLLTGDVHVSRVLKNHYGTDADPLFGYTMWEYVTSPLHRLFLSGEQNYKPTGLQHSVPEPNTFLKLEATLTTLTATWINGSGATVIGPLVLNATDLGYPAAPTGYHKASVAATSDAIDVSGASAAEGAPVVRWLYNGASNQRFQVRPLDGDYVRIVNQSSGKDLSVAGASQTPAAGIVQNTYTSGAPANDEWRLEGDGAGRVRIRNRHSNLYLTAGSTQGSQFTQQPHDAGNNLQTFTISPA